ncbi:LysM peptidoglycan-binding domain-containing protein [Gammaproteobacteria bacterium]|nr:LysM peptidoglycan-binding domain-containing protein [Gammaproteobacteria bacterium]
MPNFRSSNIQHKSSITTGSRFIAMGLALLMTACSNFQALESEPDTQISVIEEDQIVETLVSAAGDFGEADIDGLQREPVTEEEAVFQAEQTEPVTPTINMTANRVVERAINDHLQNRQTLLKIWIERSHTYFPMIEEIFAEEEVPDELKYLALGESSLRPTVRSSAGAVGMWQFMYGTARASGLEINTYVDERRDPEKATRAAARHFKELYESYNGNWEMVLAGYNCSYRCITRAARRAGKSIEDNPSYWEIYPFLPRETRGFVPKFIAAALIVSNPEMYGIQAEDFGQEITYDIVEINGMLSVEAAAMLTGTDIATIRALNPELLKASLPDQAEPYALRIPLGTFNRFVRAFDNLPVEEKVSPSEYIIVRGDTLDRIARSFDTSVDELKAVNGIRGHLIHPGQKLLIPGTGISTTIALASREHKSVAYGENQFKPIKLRDEFQLVELSGSTDAAPLMAVTLSADVEDNLMIPTIYQVRGGDTLGIIAERFNVSVREIQQWNNVRGTTIYINQELTIHSVGATPVTTYRVQRGDNLSMIARRFGVSIESIKRRNGLRNNMIFPGQDLSIN